jgi:hypothetical protein
MRHPIILLAALTIVSPFATPMMAEAKPKPKPTTPAATVAPAATTASCPYLNSSKDENTSSTNALYDPATKTLKIQVTRSVPDMFWPIAESMTRERVNKILDQCSTVNQVHVTFQSGQKMTVARDLNAKK